MAEEEKDAKSEEGRDADDLKIEDLSLDSAFLTSWELSLMEASEKEAAAAKDTARPEPEETDDIGLEELVLSGSDLDEIEESLAPRQEAAPREDGHLPLADLLLDGEFLEGWERELAGGEPAAGTGEADHLQTDDVPSLDEAPSLDETPPPEEPPGAEAGEPEPEEAGEPEGPAILRWLKEKGLPDLTPRWLYVGILALALSGLVAATVPLFLDGPKEPPRQVPLFTEKNQVLVEGLYLPLERGERSLCLSANIVLAPGSGPEGCALWFTEAAYDAVRSFKIRELKGYLGMKALKNMILARAAADGPGFYIEEINFSEDLIL